VSLGRKQLDSAREAQGPLLDAKRAASGILREESEVWANGQPLAVKQLSAEKWVEPGQKIESAQWSQELDASKLMSKEPAASVRVAAMSNGKLTGMEKDEHSNHRSAVSKLSKDIKDMQAARVANAELLGAAMTKEAERKRADAKLLQAELQYQSTVQSLGSGKGRHDASMHPASQLAGLFALFLPLPAAPTCQISSDMKLMTSPLSANRGDSDRRGRGQGVGSLRPSCGYAAEEIWGNAQDCSV